MFLFVRCVRVSGFKESFRHIFHLKSEFSTQKRERTQKQNKKARIETLKMAHIKSKNVNDMHYKTWFSHPHTAPY